MYGPLIGVHLWTHFLLIILISFGYVIGEPNLFVFDSSHAILFTVLNREKTK